MYAFVSFAETSDAICQVPLIGPIPSKSTPWDVQLVCKNHFYQGAKKIWIFSYPDCRLVKPPRFLRRRCGVECQIEQQWTELQHFYILLSMLKSRFKLNSKKMWVAFNLIHNKLEVLQLLFALKFINIGTTYC